MRQIQILPSTTQSEGARYSLLATACVAPPPAPGLARAEPAERLSDYGDALAKWVDHRDPRIGNIIVLENSGQLVNELVDEIAKRVRKPQRGIELISYVGPARAPGLHYGFSEFQMIDHLLDSATGALNERLIKTTGRYYYPAISRLLDRLPENFSFVADSVVHAAVPYLGRAGGRTTRTGLFIAEAHFFDTKLRRLYQIMQPINRLSHIDDLIFDVFRGEHGREGIYMRFPVNCEPEGIGGNGDNFGSPKKRVKGALRGLLRAVAPSIWL